MATRAHPTAAGCSAGEFSPAYIPFSINACPLAGPVFLSVQPIVPGVGVPGS